MGEINKNTFVFLGLVDEMVIPQEYGSYVWVSERCRNSIEWSKKNKKNYQILERNWSNLNELKSTLDYLRKVKKEVMKVAVTVLNDYHKTLFEESEWYFLIGSWLDAYVQILYDKYLKIKKLNNLKYELHTNIFDCSELILPLDLAEFIELTSNSDDYHLFIYSHLLQYTNLSNNVQVMEVRRYTKKELKYAKSSILAWIYQKIIYSFKKFFGIQDRIVLYNCFFPINFRFKLMKKKIGVITDYSNNWYAYGRREINHNVDKNWRNQTIDIEDNLDEFTAIACKLLKKFFPITFCEEYKHLRELAKKRYMFAKSPRAVFYSCIEGVFDEIFKTYLMSIRHTDALFCDIQHGGNYNIDSILSIEDEFNNCYFFYSWGWNITNRYRCIFKPMPVSKLINVDIRQKKMNRIVLFVNYIYPKYYIQLTYRLIYTDKLLEQEISFLKHINLKCKEDLLVRLYPYDYGWNYKSRLDAAVPGLKYDKNNKYYLTLRSAKLVILSDWSTTVLEALYYNIPIIVLRINLTTEEAKEDMLLLKKVGIIVESWKELEAQLDIIFMNIEKWWFDKKRQDVVAYFRKKYTFSQFDNDKIWTREILKFVE